MIKKDIIDKVDIQIESVHELFKKSSLNTDPQNFECISSYPSFSETNNYSGDANFFNQASDTIGLYVHIPFCKRSCDYCYYVKTDSLDNDVVVKYINALKKEINYISERLKHTKIKYIYIGGGTPTAIEKSFLADVINTIFSKFNISNDVEFTCEGCPVTLTDDMLVFLKILGVNRVSTGIQSFDDNVLQAMKREDTKHHIEKLLENLNTHFENKFNIDMIFGHHGSNQSILINDLEKIKYYNLPSVSYYQIWLYQSTPAKLKSAHITFQELLRQRMIIDEYLKQLNYKNTVTDLYIKNDEANFKFLKHKWTNNDHIGLGVGAHGYVSGHIYQNIGVAYQEAIQSINNYIDIVNRANHAVNMLHVLSDDEIEERKVFLGLKLNEYFEYPIKNEIKSIESLCKEKLILKDKNLIKLSYEGFLMLNMILKFLRGDKK